MAQLLAGVGAAVQRLAANIRAGLDAAAVFAQSLVDGAAAWTRSRRCHSFARGTGARVALVHAQVRTLRIAPAATGGTAGVRNDAGVVSGFFYFAAVAEVLGVVGVFSAAGWAVPGLA